MFPLLNDWLEQPSSIHSGHLSETSSRIPTRAGFRSRTARGCIRVGKQLRGSPVNALSGTPGIHQAPSTWQEAPGAWDAPDNETQYAQIQDEMPVTWDPPKKPLQLPNQVCERHHLAGGRHHLKHPRHLAWHSVVHMWDAPGCAHTLQSLKEHEHLLQAREITLRHQVFEAHNLEFEHIPKELERCQ